MACQIFVLDLPCRHLSGEVAYQDAATQGLEEFSCLELSKLAQLHTGLRRSGPPLYIIKNQI